MISFGTTLEDLIKSYKIEMLVTSIPRINRILIPQNSPNFKIMPDGTFEYKGVRVLYYIAKAFYTKRIGDAPSSLNKVHFVWCRTLEEQKAKGTFAQYSVTNRKHGKYHYEFNEGIVENQELLVCQNCLQQFYHDRYKQIDYEEFFNKS